MANSNLPAALPKLVGAPDRSPFRPAQPPPVYDNRPQAFGTPGFNGNHGISSGPVPQQPRHPQTGQFIPKR